MAWLVPLVLLAALAAPALHRRLGDRCGPVLALVPAGVALHAALSQVGVVQGITSVSRTPWIPSLGIDWAFRLDGLANLFVLLIAGIGAMIVLYASAYLRDHPRLGRFLSFLFVFMAAMLGIATADDLFLLFVFWEGTTVASYLLIGFQSERDEARAAARRSLLVTGAGGLSLLAGLVLLAAAGETTSLSALLERGDLVRAHPHYPWILALVLGGAFTKSAQVPFHFWLPAAMQAPTPVSAYLHSSTMVKAGVFLLARLSPVLGGTDLWLAALGGVGALTLLTGAALAVAQDDLKRLLACSTVAVLGLLTLLLGLGTPIAARAFAVTLFAHALYKATLFLVAGNVDHATGTRSLAALGGLRHAMPWTAAAALVAGVSMAGAPPLFGFLAKETAYEAALEAPRAAGFFGPVVILAATGLFFAALRVGLGPFLGTRSDASMRAHEPSPAMRLGPVVLAGAGLAAGLLVGPAERWIIAPAATAILQVQAPTGLALWHGFTPILGLSALTAVAGVALYRRRPQLLALSERLASACSALPGPTRLWDGAWDGLLRAAAWQTAVLQNGSLRRYLAVTLAAALAVTLAAAVATPIPASSASPGVTAPGAAAVLLIAGGALLALFAATSLARVAALGSVGFGVALLFLIYSAPDLAITQLVIEVLTVVLFVLVLRRLPAPRDGSALPHRPGAIALAVGGGAIMASLTLLAFHTQPAEPVSGYFLEHAVPLAHGRNVVNVILVDFRALDTLGEITVLGAAALGVLALLARRGRGASPEESR